MRIKEILGQHRRDFTAVYECEGCAATTESKGYDDAYFHQNVIPEMKCVVCNKTGKEVGADYRPLATKYPEDMQL